MNFTIEIVSVPDRDDVVAEVWWGNDMVAEMRRAENGEFLLDIYPMESHAPWSFELNRWLTALAEAQQKLS